MITDFWCDFRISLVGALGRSVSTPQKSESLSLEGESGEDLPPPMKKTRSEPAGGPLEDYTKYNQVHKPSSTKVDVRSPLSFVDSVWSVF